MAEVDCKADAPGCRGSECLTSGIRIDVRPSYIDDQSDPSARQWLFAYRIRISNEGVEPVKLLRRRWTIVDAGGNEEEVRGDGVVGHQPRIEPGQGFEYSSYCQLRTSWGTMEGSYEFRTDDDRRVDAAVGRFFLVGPDAPRR
ncbi:MAG TPA: Co2+/Mg2+ efflux protein ApaG [Phycisphaerales bacterium]|nr:Co2+/Mg2+ efflux protein ApaG [Phycisphaerales bacterium]